VVEKLIKESLNFIYVNCVGTLISPCPTIGIFIANSYYPKKAINFAQEYGIIFWDGVQISKDLASPTAISRIKDDNGELSRSKLIELNSASSPAHPSTNVFFQYAPR